MEKSGPEPPGADVLKHASERSVRWSSENQGGKRNAWEKSVSGRAENQQDFEELTR